MSFVFTVLHFERSTNNRSVSNPKIAAMSVNDSRLYLDRHSFCIVRPHSTFAMSRSPSFRVPHCLCLSLPSLVFVVFHTSEEAGAAGGEPRRISRPNSFSSITSFLRTESGASRIGQGTFSMKQLRDSIIFLKPTAAGAPRDVARREKDEDEKRERLRYIQDGPRIRDRGGERDRSEESERERARESPSPERQREKGRERDRERKEKRMPRMTSDLPPHPSTLLEIPDEDIDRWLSGSVGNSAHNSFRKSKGKTKQKNPHSNVAKFCRGGAAIKARRLRTSQQTKFQLLFYEVLGLSLFERVWACYSPGM